MDEGEAARGHEARGRRARRRPRVTGDTTELRTRLAEVVNVINESRARFEPVRSEELHALIRRYRNLPGFRELAYTLIIAAEHPELLEDWNPEIV